MCYFPPPPQTYFFKRIGKTKLTTHSWQHREKYADPLPDDIAGINAFVVKQIGLISIISIRRDWGKRRGKCLMSRGNAAFSKCLGLGYTHAKPIQPSKPLHAMPPGLESWLSSLNNSRQTEKIQVKWTLHISDTLAHDLSLTKALHVEFTSLPYFESCLSRAQSSHFHKQQNPVCFLTKCHKIHNYKFCECLVLWMFLFSHWSMKWN